MNHNYILRTKNLLLVPISEADSEKYRCLRNNKENREWFIHKEIISQDKQLEWFYKYLKNDNEYMFSIYILNEKYFTYIGAVALYNINLISKTAEIGRIIIDKTIASKHGFGSEAIQALVIFAKKVIGISEVYANIYENNIASIKSFTRANFHISNTVLDNSNIKIICMNKFIDNTEENNNGDTIICT